MAAGFSLASSPGPGGELLTGHTAPASRRGPCPAGSRGERWAVSTPAASRAPSPLSRVLSPLSVLIRPSLCSPSLPSAPEHWRASRVAGAGRTGAPWGWGVRPLLMPAHPGASGGLAHGGSAFPVRRHPLYPDDFPLNYIDCDSVQFILFSTLQQIAKFCFCFCSFGQSLLPLLVRR